MNPESTELNGVYIIEGPAKLEVLSGEVTLFDAEVLEPIIVPVGRSVPIIANRARVKVTPGLTSLRKGDLVALNKIREIAKRISELEPPVILLGPSDVGKSTIAFWSATISKLRGENVWVLSTDVGQNEVYLPAFEALVEVELPLVPGKVKREKLLSCFVGSFTPSKHLARYIQCFYKLIKRARGWTVVDTDGWIEAWEGLSSKIVLLEALESKGSIVVVGDRTLHRLLERAGIRTELIPKVIGGKKSPEERRRNRIRMISSELTRARLALINAKEANLIGFPVLNCDPEEKLMTGSRNIIYAERCNSKLTVVARGKVEVPFKIRLLREGWEKNVIVGLSNGNLNDKIGILSKINYRNLTLSVLTNTEENVKYVILGSEKISVT